MDERPLARPYNRAQCDQRSTRDRILWLLPIATSLVVGGQAVAIRLALSDLPPFRVAAVRASIATFALVAFGIATRRVLLPPSGAHRELLGIALLTTSFFATVSFALSYSPASRVSILIYLYPLLTGLLAHRVLPEETPTGRRLVTLGVGFAGAALTLTTQHSGGTGTFTGDLLAIGGACILTAYNIWIKRLSSKVHPFSIALYPTALSAFAFMLLTWAFESGREITISQSTILALLYQGIVVGGGSVVMWTVAMRRLPATELVACDFLTPIWGVLAGAVLLREPLSGKLLMGLACVAGSLLAMGRYRPGARSPSRRLP